MYFILKILYDIDEEFVRFRYIVLVGACAYAVCVCAGIEILFAIWQSEARMWGLSRICHC